LNVNTWRMAALLLICATPSLKTIEAASWNSVLRRAAKVADDVPLKQTDEVAEQLARSPLAREALEKQLRRAGDLPAGGLLDDASRAAAITKRLSQATKSLDPALVKNLDELVSAERGVALVFVEGGQRVAATIPDVAARGRFLERGGAETVAAIGLLGDDAAKAALRFDTAIQAGKLVSPKGLRPVTLADFGKSLVNGGDRTWNFVTKKILPHWDRWLIGGALAAFVIDPDGFIDAAGELTERGVKRLTELVGQEASHAILGIGQGSGKAISKIVDAIFETYFANWRTGVAALIGTIVFFSVVLPRPRSWLWKHFRRLVVSSPQ